MAIRSSPVLVGRDREMADPGTAMAGMATLQGSGSTAERAGSFPVQEVG